MAVYQSDSSVFDDDSEDDAFVASMRARLGKGREEAGNLAEAKETINIRADGDSERDSSSESRAGTGAGAESGPGPGPGAGAGAAGDGAGAGAGKMKTGWDQDVNDTDW